MYDFLTGPFAWVAFGIFFVGVFFRLVLFVRHPVGGKILKKIQSAASNGLKIGSKPNTSPRLLVGKTDSGIRKGIVYFSPIYLPLLVVLVIFLPAHNVLLKQKWGFRFYTLPSAIGDILVIAVIVIALLMIIRRLFSKAVRKRTPLLCYLLLLLIAGPFITGFIAFHQFFTYQTWITLHILSGEILLIFIPFIRYSQVIQIADFLQD